MVAALKEHDAVALGCCVSTLDSILGANWRAKAEPHQPESKCVSPNISADFSSRGQPVRRTGRGLLHLHDRHPEPDSERYPRTEHNDGIAPAF